MAARVTKLPLQRPPTHPSSSSSSPEQKFWHSFQSPLLINDYSSITDINFSPVSPHDFAVTSSTRIQIFSSKTRKPIKTISRFKDIAYSGYIRKDGKALVAGDETGLVQVFDLNSRAILRSWGGSSGNGGHDEGHKQAVHVTRFSPTSNTVVLSASDDTTVRLWDLPTGKVTNLFMGHGDYVRNAEFLVVGGGGSSGGSGEVVGLGMVVSGGYDGFVKLWDPRISSSSSSATSVSDSDSAVMTLKHPNAIDAILPMPGGTTILSAAGSIVYVWDIIAAKPLTQLENHQKTVTALSFTYTKQQQHNKDSIEGGTGGTAGGGGSGRRAGRVISGSLDGHVKIYDTTSWTIVHGIKYPSPILSLSISPDQKHLVVGMDSGLLSIRSKTSIVEKQLEKEKERIYQSILEGTVSTTQQQEEKDKKKRRRKGKGLKYKGDFETDKNIILHFIDPFSKKGGKIKLSPWEKLLRQGKYSEALDYVLSSSSSSSSNSTSTSTTSQKTQKSNISPITVYTLLLHLRHTTSLHAALANRDPQSLAPILKWLIKYVKRPQFVEIIVDVGLIVLDLYSGVLGQSRDINNLIGRLKEVVGREVESCQMANRIVGMVGMLVGGAGDGGGGFTTTGGSRKLES